jgi:phosphonate transport system substrate-binding protein
VNNVGFVPIAVAGDEHGPDGHRLNIIVNANSPMQVVSDIRGQVLECSQPLSITGYRAPLAYLSKMQGLQAGQDYQVTFSGTPSQSIRDIVNGATAAAAVSNDKLISMKGTGEISPKDYRVLYESEVIPRFAMGTMYNQ